MAHLDPGKGGIFPDELRKGQGCPFCDSPTHHTDELAMNVTGQLPEGLVIPEIGDASHHSLMAFAGVIRKYGVEGDDIFHAYQPIAQAIGWTASAAVNRAISLGRMQGLEHFIDQLIQAHGEGDYVFELRKGDPSPAARRLD
jgi:hypothetical protein